jgi:hypothetical protein
MANVRIDPEENKTSAALQHQGVIAKGEAQLEMGVKAHTLKPDDHASASQIRAANVDLDKFRHLFGPKRRGR